ncbi:MAG TPA: hypothetical protein VF376_00270 [Thermoanaerobaculia bacterium]
MARKVSLALAVFGLATSMFATEAVTQKLDWKPANGSQDVHIENARIVISQLDFDLGGVMTSTPIRRSSAKVVARVDNNGWIDQEVGIAIVILDGDGNVVAAGSGGTKWGFLNKGERDRYTIYMPYVYRRIGDAKTVMVTLETKEKPGKHPKPTPTP